jgi:hypothetical protein
MKTVKDMIAKTNMIELKIEEYADALKKSMYDEQWINNLYTDKENIFRLFEKVGKNCPIKNAVRFAETRDIRYLLETKNNLTLPESISNLYFEAGKPEQTMILINEIFSSTLYYAERIKDLINEYSMNTRTFFETTLQPYPENISDTWKPIKRFKLENHVLSIDKNTLHFENQESPFSDYFIERKNKKLLKKLFINYKIVSETDYKNIKRRLLNFKEVSIPTNFAYCNSDNAKYKITTNASQTVNRDGVEFTLLGDRINVLHIQEIK